jgi:hypothetical protein
LRRIQREREIENNRRENEREKNNLPVFLPSTEAERREKARASGFEAD